MPLLRDEQGTTRSVAALHGTVLAVGAVLAGLLGVALTRRLGRRAVVTAGALLVAAGVLLLVGGPGLPATLAGALLAGTGGSIALTATSPALAEHHGPAGAAALAEGNAVAALVGVAGPLAVGGAVAAGLGWRPAVAVAVPLAVVAAATLRAVPNEPALGRGAPRRPAGAARPPLGVPFWLLTGVLSLGVGVEFATTFWAGDLVADRLEVGPGAAVASVTAFVAGMAVGRFVAGRLALRHAARPLVLGAIGVAVVGWALLWLATGLPVALTGLLVAGLGVALLFPLSLSLLMDASRGRRDTASSVGSVGTGVAIGTAPFVLGALSDAVGPHRGFLLIPVLLAVAAALLVGSGVAGRRRE